MIKHSKGWLYSGLALGFVLTLVGRWDLGVGVFVFCVTASFSQARLDAQNAHA